MIFKIYFQQVGERLLGCMINTWLTHKKLPELSSKAPVYFALLRGMRETSHSLFHVVANRSVEKSAF